jgi:hypothetical protein
MNSIRISLRDCFGDWTHFFPSPIVLKSIGPLNHQQQCRNEHFVRYIKLITGNHGFFGPDAQVSPQSDGITRIPSKTLFKEA